MCEGVVDSFVVIVDPVAAVTVVKGPERGPENTGEA